MFNIQKLTLAFLGSFAETRNKMFECCILKRYGGETGNCGFSKLNGSRCDRNETLLAVLKKGAEVFDMPRPFFCFSGNYINRTQ